MKLNLKRIALQLAALMLMVIYLFFFSLRASAEEFETADPRILNHFPMEYCADISDYTQDSTSFRRINLEDTAGLDCGTAGRIRAIVLQSYPQKNVVAIQARANAWLRGHGLPEIVDLRNTESVLAAQLAIREITNEDRCFGGAEDLKETENTAQNIESLYTYLCDLDAITPKYEAVSDSGFENPRYSAVREEDGTYTVTVDVTVNATVGPKDELTIRAVCAGLEWSESITHAGEYSFTFAGLSAESEVNLEITGFQCGGDVYLFDTEGEPGAFISYDDRKLSVHSSITVNTDRILNIFVGTDKQPLSNIRFDIYQVAAMDQLESGEVKLSDVPTQEEITKYKTSTNLIAAMTTNSQGVASYNFTQKEKPDGVYMIVERFSASTTGAVSPFYITLPAMREDGRGYSCSRNLSFQKDTETGPEISKEVLKIDERGTFAPGQYHTWRIRGSIPAGIGDARKYGITDFLDSRLIYEKGSPIVKLYTEAGTEVMLEKDVHYTLTEGTVKVNSGAADRFRIALTPAGMAYVAANLGEGEYIPEVRICFNAVIREDADLSTQIPDAARLEYTNSAGAVYKADVEKTEPQTADDAITIISTDPLLPEIGEMDTSAFTVTGIGILGAASALLFANRKGSV